MVRHTGLSLPPHGSAAHWPGTPDPGAANHGPWDMFLVIPELRPAKARRAGIASRFAQRFPLRPGTTYNAPMMFAEWEIKARSHTCAHTQIPFNDGDTIWTLLFRDKHGFRREDISDAAWIQSKESVQPFSFWKSKYQAPPTVPPEPMQKESVEALLRRLLDEDRPDYLNTRYVLAAMLERKKILKPVDARETDSERILVYEHAKSGEAFLIVDPRLRLDQLGAVQDEVAVLLANGLAAQQPEQ
jgi:hypothetical protein